ncbi:MAG: glycosyltransferase [Bacteroidales bacterium]|nr:glycosyltransferase [Bacteroidales bacterium]
MPTSYHFTVIIPHHTKSGVVLLERSVNSIPDDESIQILVIDNSPASINQNLFKTRSNVKVLFSDRTKGAGHARNVGLQHSKGKWILFLDADDFFLNDAFNIVRKYIQSSYDIIFFKPTSCYSDTFETANRHIAYAKIIDNYLCNKDDYKLRCSFPVPWSKMIKKDFLKNNGILFDETPASNDVIFSLKTGLAANTIFADKAEIYCITVTKGSITNTISLKNIESRFDVSILKNKILKANGYKKDTSVMLFILSSIRFGIIPFSKLFFKALITGNLFIGYNRWFKTLLKTNKNKNTAYKVKEKI